MVDIEKEHASLVARTCKSGEEIVLSPLEAHLVHMALGIAGEAGEIVDAIKKNAIYRKPLDNINVMEELGDLEWYMEGLRSSLELSRKQVLEYNINKLNKRYGAGYSDESAITRADKA